MDRRAFWVSGILMGLLGLLLGLQEAGARLTTLVMGTAAFNGGPRPRSIEWIEGLTAMQRRLSVLEDWLELVAAALAVVLVIRLLRLLNPHGTLLAPEEGVRREASGVSERPPLLTPDASRLTPRPAPWSQRPLRPALVRRCSAAALFTVYLLGGLGLLAGREFPLPLYLRGLGGLPDLWPGQPWAAQWLAFMLGGALLWLLWGEWGAVTPPRPPSHGRLATMALGLATGAVAFPALLPLTPAGRQSLDLLLAATGLADPRPWEQLLWGWLLGLPAAFLALGLLGHALARPGPVRGALVPFCAAVLLLFGWKAAAMAGRAATRLDAAGDLAGRIGAARRPSSTRTYLLFPPSPAGGPLPGAVPFMSIEGIDAGNDSPRRTWEYLRERRFKTASAWKAFVHLHDCASLRWDSAESLRVDLASLEQNPQPVFAGLLVEKLSTCATSPENRVFLRQAAEPDRFRPDPEWLRTLALLHHRFGDRRAALELLSQARVEPEEADRLLPEGLPLTAGRVSGRVMVNGRPGAGLTVGVVPAGRWQGLVGTPRPFEHRWVAAAASTDADGRFRLRDLGEGEYVLIVMGDPETLPLRGPDVRAEGQPGLLRLDRSRPGRDVGTIRIDTGESASPALRAEIGTS